MFEYIIGKVTNIYDLYIIIECNQIGYKFYVTDNNYKTNDQIKINTYLYINDDLRIYFGFKECLEKELFIRLMQIKNIGVKSAYSILRKFNYQDIINAAFINDSDYLLKIPKINPDNINVLRKKIESIKTYEVNTINKSYLSTLRTLEYDDELIYKSYKLIDKSQEINDQIKAGIKIIEEGKI